MAYEIGRKCNKCGKYREVFDYDSVLPCMRCECETESIKEEKLREIYEKPQLVLKENKKWWQFWK